MDGGGHIWNVAGGGFRNWAGINTDKRREFPVEKIADDTFFFKLAETDETGEFEEFVHKSVAIAQLAPNIAVSRNGNLTLNFATVQLLGSPDGVVLLYNDEIRAIGVRPARPEERHARPLRKASSQRTWTVSAEGFLKAFGIEHEEGRSYQPVLEGA